MVMLDYKNSQYTHKCRAIFLPLKIIIIIIIWNMEASYVSVHKVIKWVKFK